MIAGFENETAPLSRDELKYVPFFCTYLSNHCVGSANVRKNQWIAECVTDAAAGHIDLDKPCRLDEARVRKIINYIRRNALVPCLIATSQGYYVSDNEQEIKDFELSLLNRELAIREVRESITKQRHERFGSLTQGTLF